MRSCWILVLALSGLAACQKQGATTPNPVPAPKGASVNEKVAKSSEEWRKELSPEQYRVTCEGGTERPFTGKYWNHHENGLYKCVRCGYMLFSSDAKYDSGSGWPSYHSPVAPDAVGTKSDLSYGMVRTEITCAKCGAHLGHLFDDGPKPTGKRFCVNSASLDFEKKK